MSKGLGRGLSSLISERKDIDEKQIEEQTAQIVALDSTNRDLVKTELLHQGKYQPRTFFDENELAELADSIKKNGIVQPIIVREAADNNGYEIIAGERRWRAAKINAMENVPVIIMKLDDKQALEIGLVENIQRQNLKPLEEAEGYQRLINDFSYTQEALSEVIGKSRSNIANCLRILALPSEVKELLNDDKITSGHARALLSADKPLELANEIYKKGLNVRQTEKLVKQSAKFPKRQRSTADKEKDPETIRLEKQISKAIGLKLSINANGEKGKIVIAYNNLSELDEILKRLGR